MEFAEMVKMAADEYKSAQSELVKTAGVKVADEHYTAFALGVIKFAADAELSMEEFVDFHSRALAYMSQK